MQSKSTGTGGAGGIAGGGGAIGSGGAVSASGGSRGLGGAVDAKSSADAATCDDLARAARKRFDGFVGSLGALACQTDSDCGMLHLQTLNCIGPCGELVSAPSIPAVTAVATDTCAEYVAAGCSERRVLCISGGDPVCEQGQCRYFQPGVTERSRDGLRDGAVDSPVSYDVPLSKLDAP